MKDHMRWLIPLLVTIGIAANGMTVNWVNTKFNDHTSRPHVGTVTTDQYHMLRQDIKEMQHKLEKLTNQVIRLQVLLIEGGPK